VVDRSLFGDVLLAFGIPFVRKRYWWRFGETTPALFAAIAPLEREGKKGTFYFFLLNDFRYGRSDACHERHTLPSAEHVTTF